MLRWFVTLWLIASFLAGALGGWPHAHAAQAADHGARPHVHWDWLARFFSASDHPAGRRLRPGHEHQHGDHRHGHESSGQQSPTRDAPDDEHDSNCVYLAAAAHGAVTTAPAALPLRPACGGCDDYQPIDEVIRRVSFRSHWAHAPPGSLRDGCALILALRTLRI